MNARLSRLGPWVWAVVSLALILVFNLVFTPGFFSIQARDGHFYGSLIDIANRAAPVMLVALGMTLVIATGGIDLSVGATMSIVGSVAALMVTKGHSPLAAILTACLFVALALGAWNGILVAVFKIQPIVATLILMVSGRGIAQLLTDGQIIQFHDPSLAYIGSGFLFKIPFSITVVVIVLLITAAVTRLTAMGLFIESVGDNPTASRYSGIDIRTVQLFAYAFCAICAGMAGLVATANTSAADANNTGLNLELDAILAVVIGGTKLTGGRYQLIGSIFGALVIQSLTTTILTKGLAIEFTLVVKALTVLAVCLLQSPQFRTKFRLPARSK
ncbi:MAG: ABC transporter permease [Fimbriimonas sp.]|nr:ABC transporter permease [Fimbriimonas sp.]